ncbi:virulence protein SciE type [Rhodobacteraceae bacterium CCMM004]|nr:virulence protein SciE type [Rhodobacteraceae bacterium CCMM004]
MSQNDVTGALAALQDRVRADPADAKLRIFLFQLLCVTGDWKRAITQLKLCAELDAAAIPMAQTYREGIICEVFRERVFAGEKAPLIFGEPEDWIAWMIEATKALAEGRAEDAAALRARAFEAAPATPGRLNGEPFEWIADADMRLGPLLEIVVNGKYYWMPFGAIRRIQADPPADLRDTVWTAVNVELRNGGSFVALVPTRYAGTVAQGDDAARLARKTEWVDAGGESYVGIGQRLLATDQGDVALMDLRTLEFEPAEVPADGDDG